MSMLRNMYEYGGIKIKLGISPTEDKDVKLVPISAGIRIFG